VGEPANFERTPSGTVGAQLETNPQEESMTDRDKYRDNDDMRDPVPGDERLGVKPDSRSEARGDARETVGNNARGTDAAPYGPEGNDKTRGRPRPGPFDEGPKNEPREKR
jgi:hypothetical protein